MSYCSQTLTGLPLECEASQGGIRAVYIANFGDVDKVTETDNIITAVTMKNAAKFYRYQLRKNTSNMEFPLTVEPTAGTKFWTTNIFMNFGKMTTAKRVEIEALTAGQFIAIVEDANGTLWMPSTPTDDYMAASAGNGGTGTARTDANKYDMTLTGEATHAPIEVSREALKDIVEE